MNDPKQEIENHRSSHKFVFCKIDAVKILTKAVKNARERVYVYTFFFINQVAKGVTLKMV